MKIPVAPSQSHIAASGITVSLFSAYVILYGGYSKVQKSYDITNRLRGLFSITNFQKNPLAQGKELNKIVALTAMSMVSVAATGSSILFSKRNFNSNRHTSLSACCYKNIIWALSQQAVLVTLGHSVFSNVFYVARDPKKFLLGEKALSVVAGSTGFAGFIWLSWLLQPKNAAATRETVSVAAAVCSVLTAVHVFLMERKVVVPKQPKQLDMRPMGVWGLYAHIGLSVIATGLAMKAIVS